MAWQDIKCRGVRTALSNDLPYKPIWPRLNLVIWMQQPIRRPNQRGGGCSIKLPALFAITAEGPTKPYRTPLSHAAAVPMPPICEKIRHD